jgi:hypothetical protein
MRNLIVTISFGLITASAQSMVWQSDGTPQNIQFIHDNRAVDGDTITLPSGTFSWTTHVTITKGVTIQGNTTTNSDTGVCNDLTNLVDNINRSTPGGEGFFHCTITSGKAFRITGVTFTGQGGNPSTAFNGAIRIDGGSHQVRFDHLHFTGHLAHNSCMNIGAGIYGVIDHVVMDQPSGQNGQQRAYNGTGYGDLEWTQPAGWGGPNFIFMEDCYLNNSGQDFSTAFGWDSLRGGRYVVRHCHLYNIELLNHGTDSGGRSRASRGYELYNNDYHWDFHNAGMDGIRGGAMIVHDNTFDGVAPGGGFNLQNYRIANCFGSAFGGATGVNPWDSNDPVLYESGTVAAVVYNAGNYQDITDSTKNWFTNQWVGYTVSNTARTSLIHIQSNTATTLHGPEFGYGAPAFQVGQAYEIRKPLLTIDQPCRGAGDLITGDVPINTTTGTPAWPHQVREPCYSWNNIYTPTGAHINLGISFNNPPLVENVDYFNDTPMPGYTPYCYPHPLVSGVPCAATPGP